MKGKSEFTKEEISTIEELIKRKLEASANEQKAIRNKIRKIGFYWTDFVEDSTEYNVENFRKLIEDGSIKIVKE